MSIVIDASVAPAWVFEDERHDAAWSIIDRLIQGGAGGGAGAPARGALALQRLTVPRAA